MNLIDFLPHPAGTKKKKRRRLSVSSVTFKLRVDSVEINEVQEENKTLKVLDLNLGWDLGLVAECYDIKSSSLVLQT